MKFVERYQVLFINVYWFGLAIMWNSLNTIVIPAMMIFFAPEDLKNTYLGGLKFLGLLIAMFIQPLAGAISDNWASRWGRRRPLVLLGTLGDCVFLAVLGWAGGLWAIFFGFLCLQVCSNVAQGPLQGLLPDVIPAEKIGIASSVKILMEMIGTVIAMLVIGKLIPPGTKNPTTAMLAMILVLAVCASITLAWSREKSTLGTARQSLNIAAILRETFLVWNVKAPQGYWWLLISRFFFLFAVTGIQSFVFNYIQDKLGAENPVKTTADLMAAIVGALMVCAFVTGLLIERLGPKRMLLLAGIVGTAGALLLLIAHSTNLLLIYGCVFGAGTGIFLSANWSLANNMAQGDDAGKLMGLSNFATAGAPLVAQALGVPIDLLNTLWQGQWMGYSMLFLLGAFVIIISTVLLVKVPEHKAAAT
jgi:MFS family permease